MRWLDETDPLAPDPVLDAYEKDIDLTLLRRNLRKTVDERFRDQMQLQRFAEELRAAGERARNDKK